MIKTFTCSCGNTDPQKAKAYEGLLGYEALVCKVCGRFSDYQGEHEAGDWSRQLVGLQNILPNIKVGMIVQLHRKPTSTNNATIVFRGIKSIDYDKKTIVCDDAVEYKFKDIIKPS
jgi:hypothetical protein